jgi:allantoin racemase
MRILLIIPITGLDERAIEERLEYLRSMARSETTIDYVQIEEGPPAIESAVDHTIASAEILKYVDEAEASGFDAIIVWCGGDPGVEEAMTMVDIPVVGPGESMRLIASLMGKKVGRVPAPLPVLDLRKDTERTYQLTRSAIEGLIEEGYDSFWLSCLGMWGMGKPLREELGLPVVDGAEASLKMAELAVDLSLRPSRIAYPMYPPRHRALDDAGADC